MYLGFPGHLLHVGLATRVADEVDEGAISVAHLRVTWSRGMKVG